MHFLKIKTIIRLMQSVNRLSFVFQLPNSLLLLLLLNRVLKTFLKLSNLIPEQSLSRVAKTLRGTSDKYLLRHNLKSEYIL